MNQDIESRITYLLDRQEIQDIVAKYARSQDRLDQELCLSVFHDDAFNDYGYFAGDREQFTAWAFTVMTDHIEMTQHFLGNHLAEIDGDEAHAETYFLWIAKNRVGSPFSYAGGRYLDRLEKRDGRWGIVERCCVMDFAAPAVNTREAIEAEQNQLGAVFENPVERSFAAAARVTRRDRGDAVYDRPLHIDSARRSLAAAMAEQKQG